jgi:hypothetical protein
MSEIRESAGKVFFRLLNTEYATYVEACTVLYATNGSRMHSARRYKFFFNTVSMV